MVARVSLACRRIESRMSELESETPSGQDSRLGTLSNRTVLHFHFQRRRFQ
jgi:hypothetical protein